MFKTALLALFALLALQAGVSAATVDGIAAVVNSEIITSSELSEAMAMYQKAYRQGAPKDADSIRREVLDKMIDDILLKSAIEKEKITVEDEELTRAIANVLRQNKITPEQLRADLAAKGISFETYKMQLASQIRMIKFTNQVVGSHVKLNEHDLRNYYDQNKDRFGGNSSTFEAVRDRVYDALYEEKAQEALHNYLQRERQRAYIDIR